MFDSGGGGRTGWWVGKGPPAATKHERHLPPPDLAIGYLDLPPRPMAVATYPRQQADGAVDVDPVPTARAGGGRVF